MAKGRSEFMTQFRSIDVSRVAVPHDAQTFERCKLDHSERETHIEDVRLHRDLLRLRRQLAPANHVDGAVLGEFAFVLRFDDDRILIVNLGPALELDVAPEPLLAPPESSRWKLIWSSDDTNAVEFEKAPSWRIPREAAVLLNAVRYTRE